MISFRLVADAVELLRRARNSRSPRLRTTFGALISKDSFGLRGLTRLSAFWIKLGLQQQERFDRFIDEYNSERPHEALGQRPPCSVFASSPRTFDGTIPELRYPLHDLTKRVEPEGHIRFGRKHVVYLSQALARETVGLREVDNDRWLISFANLDLAVWDLAKKDLNTSEIEGDQ